MFQNEVRTEQGLGVIGEFAFIGPTRAKSYILDSTDEANNVIGRVFTVKSEGIAEAGGDAGLFAGIMINPKSLPVENLFTNADGELAVKNGTSVELCEMGEIIIKATEAAAIGAPLNYADATGVIGFGAAEAGETDLANAVVSTFTVAGAGIAVAKLTN